MRLSSPLTFLLSGAVLVSACFGGDGGADDDEGGNDAGESNGGSSGNGSGGNNVGGGNSGGSGGTGGDGSGGTGGGTGGNATGGNATGGTGGTGGSGGNPATCATPPTVSGQLANSIAAVDFSGEPASVAVEHKIDIDVGEDGCISGAVITLQKAGQGCALQLAYATNAAGDALELVSASFSADSFCPGWTDADEGEYYYLASKTDAFLNIASKVPDRTAPTSCFNTQIQLQGTVTLQRSDNQSLELNLAGLTISGDVQSTGNEDATCPVQPVGTGGTGGAGGTGGGGTGGAGGTGGGDTGGTGGTGGSAGAGGAPTCGTGFAVFDGGYMTSYNAGTCWRGHGYVGTSAGSTYSPLDFSTCTTPCALCASGTLIADTTYASTGWIGVNLNQEYLATAAGTVTPVASSLTLSYTNAGGTPLRVQLGGPNAATDENDRWCYALSAASSTVTIPYGSFNTMCWDNSGTQYAGQPIQSISLTFPSSATATTPWSACITGLY